MSNAYETYQKMNRQGKVQTTSKEFGYRFEHQCALKFAPVKKKSNTKEFNSRKILDNIVLTTAEI